MVYAIVPEVSYINLKAMRFRISSKTWTSYVKDVGMVLSEELERERGEPQVLPCQMG